MSTSPIASNEFSRALLTMHMWQTQPDRRAELESAMSDAVALGLELLVAMKRDGDALQQWAQKADGLLAEAETHMAQQLDEIGRLTKSVEVMQCPPSAN
jgi:hypothetical protein